ncbi:hypothetical protein C8Q73DRAFT_450834 [Cubamyces lactineus]|nr:hypothetical protein C8Q73DRAFT_450834 [Cubamyces lactineus]
MRLHWSIKASSPIPANTIFLPFVALPHRSQRSPRDYPFPASIITMQFLATLTTLVLAFAGAASAVPYYASQSQCSSGSMQCCNNVQSASSPSMLKALEILSLAGLVDGDSNIGTSCTPINIVGAGGTESCTAMPVCCNGNSFGSLSFGCSSVASII